MRGVVALEDHYVCDGLIARLVHLGPNYRKNYSELYKQLRQTGKFHVNPLLPATVKTKTTKTSLSEKKRNMNKGAKKEPAREKRIEMEIVVDAYGAAMAFSA